VAARVSELADVQLVEIVPKEAAWKEMQSAFKVASLSNPLPNTLHIKVSSTEAVEKVANRVRALSSVETVRYPLNVARRINEIRHFLEIAGLVVTAALTAATLTVISNTIHLVIQSRHREIEILSLMGVSPFYIRSPLILQGAVYGFISGLLAMSVLLALHVYIEPFVSEQLVSIAPLVGHSIEFNLYQTFAALLLLGVAVGASGAFWTSGRYIKI
jgi:cell division transport system permease protein